MNEQKQHINPKEITAVKCNHTQRWGNKEVPMDEI